LKDFCSCALACPQKYRAITSMQSNLTTIRRLQI
jgi:hypothetical protein